MFLHVGVGQCRAVSVMEKVAHQIKAIRALYGRRIVQKTRGRIDRIAGLPIAVIKGGALYGMCIKIVLDSLNSS